MVRRGCALYANLYYKEKAEKRPVNPKNKPSVVAYILLIFMQWRKNKCQGKGEESFNMKLYRKTM